MAKKILSILCALAMMVTMVSVVAFSASAAEPVAMGKITSENWEKWAAADSGSHGTSGYYNIATAGDSIWAMGQNTNVRITSTIGTYNISDAYTLAFDMFYRSESNKVDRTVYTVTVGDLVLTFGDNNHNLPFSATYNGTAVTFDKDTMLHWDHYTSTTQANIMSELLAAGVTSNWITNPDSGSATYYPNKLIGVEIKLEDGNLTVRSTHKGNTPFTADLTAAGYDKTVDLGETEVKLAVEINKGDIGTLISGLGNFTGSYAAATTGGTTPPPAGDEDDDGEGNFAGLADMTVTKDNAYSSTDWWGNQGSGLYTSAKFGGAAILANQNKIIATSTATYDVESFTVEYFLNRNRGGNSTSGSVYGHLNTFKLGDLTVQLTSSNAPETTCTIFYGGTQLATGTSVFEHHTLLEKGSDEAKAVVADMLAGFENGGFADEENRMEEIVIITFKDGKVTVTYGDVNNAELRTVVEADIADADFSDATLELAVAERKNDGSVLHSFTGTYNGDADEGGTTPPPAGDEDDDDDDQQGGTTPPPAGDEDDDDDNQQGGTTPPPAGDEDDDDEGGVVIEPSVITFNATKGTVTTATAVTNEEGKLATLPTPTYTGAGTFVFDGWYTAEAGGTKITTDTVFEADTTVYAQWTRTLTTTAMDGFDKATCELPEEMPWNASGSGLFKTSGHGDGLVVGNQAAFGLTAELGTYNIDSYFKVDFDLWYKNKSVESGCVAGVEFQIVSIGDLVITFTRSPANISDRAGRNLYLQSVTYKGQEVELVGEKNFSSDCTDQYEHNDEFVINNANVEFSKFLEDNMIRKAWMFNNNAWPNNLLAVEVTYDAGMLTIKNTSGTVTNSVAADLTKVAGFDVKTAFNNSKVTARAEATDARGAFVSIISDFHGAYEKVAAQGGTGTGTGTGTGNGNGGSNAPQTGDNRNLVLPICVALASVAVAGATLIRRKRA